MRRLSFAAALYLSLDAPGAATVEPFPPSFHVLDIKTSGALIHVLVGGRGPAMMMPMPRASRAPEQSEKHQQRT